MKFTHAKLIAISGLIWFAAGFFLLNIGFGLLLGNFDATAHFLFLDKLSQSAGGFQQASLLVIATALGIGYLKGKYVLGKSARQGAERILSFPNPTSIKNIYSKKYYILLASMVGLGMSIKYLGLPNDVRGAIDIAIGAALVNGAVVYFRLAAGIKSCGNAA